MEEGERERETKELDRLNQISKEFAFKSTLRTADLLLEIAKMHESCSPAKEKYDTLCYMVYIHAEDRRRTLEELSKRVKSEAQLEELRHIIQIVSMDKIVYQMGHILTKIRGVKNSSAVNTCFIRKTRKFWVHQDNVECIIAQIIKHLPLYVFGDDGSGKIDTAISSVYFDTKDFKLYENRIRRAQGAKALRIRRYGESSPVAYVELKTHEEDWTGEKSTKRRFAIHVKLIKRFVFGEDIWSEIRSINEEDGKALYDGVHGMMQQYKLVPIVKTTYMRKAFQIPGDASTRISIDTGLCMWKGDCGKKFPYVVLEVKEEEGSEKEWVKQLTESSLVEKVDKFSKYIHGCSVHYEALKTVPYWFEQMGTDIKKIISPDHGKLSAEERSKLDQALYEKFRSENYGIAEIFDKINEVFMEEFEEPEAEDGREDAAQKLPRVEKGSMGVRREKIPSLQPLLTGDAGANPPAARSSETKPVRESPVNRLRNGSQREGGMDRRLDGREETESPRTQSETIDKFFENNATNNPAKDMGKRMGAECGASSKSPQSLMRLYSEGIPTRTENEKRIMIPVRVEPKVFFANERTFLSWLHFAIFIGGIGAALMGLGDQKAAYSGVCFILVSIIFSVYALYLFFWRANRIREKDPGPYDDLNGPVVLVAVFLSAMVTSIFFKFPLK